MRAMTKYVTLHIAHVSHYLPVTERDGVWRIHFQAVGLQCVCVSEP